jgi:hypothetical protein
MVYFYFMAIGRTFINASGSIGLRHGPERHDVALVPIKQNSTTWAMFFLMLRTP